MKFCLCRVDRLGDGRDLVSNSLVGIKSNILLCTILQQLLLMIMRQWVIIGRQTLMSMYVSAVQCILRVLWTIPHHRHKHHLQPGRQFGGDFRHHGRSTRLRHLDVSHRRVHHRDDHRQHVLSDVLLVDIAQRTLIGQSRHYCRDFRRVLLAHCSCVCSVYKAEPRAAIPRCHR